MNDPTPPAGDAAGIPEPTDEERHKRRESAVRRACELMGWEYKTYPAYTGIRRVALAEAVAISLEKLDELLDAIAAARRERDELLSQVLARDCWARDVAEFHDMPAEGEDLFATVAIYLKRVKQERDDLRRRCEAMERAGDGIRSLAERGADGVFFASQALREWDAARAGAGGED